MPRGAFSFCITANGLTGRRDFKQVPTRYGRGKCPLPGRARQRAAPRKINAQSPRSFFIGKPPLPCRRFVNQCRRGILNFYEGLSPSINSGLSIRPSENAVFSRHYARLMLKPYVSALVFALTSRNKGNAKWLLAGNKPSALESEIHPSHKPVVCT